MFIQTETTPNPETLKFLPGCLVAPNNNLEFHDIKIAEKQSLLAVKLLSLPGIDSVFFGHDFITVKKYQSNWKYLKPVIFRTIMEHLLSGEKIIHHTFSLKNEEFFSSKDIETVNIIKNIINTRIQPIVSKDGGKIVFRGFKDHTVYLTMHGSCSGCPSSKKTLKNGIEKFLSYFIPEVKKVEQIL